MFGIAMVMFGAGLLTGLTATGSEGKRRATAAKSDPFDMSRPITVFRADNGVRLNLVPHAWQSSGRGGTFPVECAPTKYTPHEAVWMVSLDGGATLISCTLAEEGK